MAATQQSENIAWKEVGLALLVLVPVVAVEALNGGRLTWLVLPFLLVGVGVGAWRHWPWGSLWWLGWTLLAATLAGLFWLPGPARPPIVFVFPWLFLLGFLIFVGLAIWQRGDGLRIAFCLFPWSLEVSRFVLFDDILPEKTARSFVLRLVSLIIYAIIATLFIRRLGRRARWLSLLVGALTYLIAAIVTSLPIFAFYFLFLVYLPSLLLLAVGFLLLGLALDGVRARGQLSLPGRLGVLALLFGFIIGLLIPWLGGGTLRAAPYAPRAAQLTGPRQAVIVDTDLSNDDYVAILYLLQRPDVDIRAITVVDGVSHANAGLQNMRRLLAAVGRGDIPLAAGPSAPLVGDNAFPYLWRCILSWVVRPGLPKLESPTAFPPPPDLMRQTVAESPTPVTLIALGPLTNVAQALEDDPTLTSHLDGILISGGAIYVEDPSSPSAAEWNLFIDPYADDLVFRSGARLILVPLDVTDAYGPSPILINQDFVSRFAASTNSLESRWMAHLMKVWSWTNPRRDVVPLWDAPAVAITVDPAICTEWRELALRVLLDPGEAGRIVVDEDAQPNARVCLEGDQAAFEASYLAVSQ